VLDSILFPNAITTMTATDRAQLNNIVATWWANGGNQGVRVDGFASLPGSPALNWRLSCERARTVADALERPTGLLRGIPSTMISIFMHGETDAFGPEPENRRASVSFAIPTPTTRTFRVVAKSFIRHIGWATGTSWCPRLGDLLSIQSNVALQILATSTDAMFGETAPSSAKDGAYRLYSSVDFTVTCSPDGPTTVTASAIDTDVGVEPVPLVGPWTPPPMITTGPTLTPAPGGSTRFHWFGKGRPPGKAELGFRTVCSRSSVYIWHDIEGVVDCSGVRITAFDGSHFPTHRAYIGTAPPVRTIPQGDFINLWESHPSDSTMVR
jgi:hypothetical protein